MYVKIAATYGTRSYVSTTTTNPINARAAQRREARRCLFLLRSAFLVQGMDFPALFYHAHGPAVDGLEERWLGIEPACVRDYRPYSSVPELQFAPLSGSCGQTGARGPYAAGGESGGPIS
jgi:hypothetical protein